MRSTKTSSLCNLLWGLAYIDKDPALAKSYFEEAIRTAEKLEEIPEETKKVLREDINQSNTNSSLKNPLRNLKKKPMKAKRAKGNLKLGKRLKKMIPVSFD